MSGKQYGAYARVPLCRACGNPFVPPGYDGCCSVRCTQYLEVARQPVLGDPVFCQRDEPIKCWSCEVSFISRGLRYCPECYFKARPQAAPVVSNASDTPRALKSADLRGFEAVGVGVGLRPASREPISDRWRRLDDSEA